MSGNQLSDNSSPSPEREKAGPAHIAPVLMPNLPRDLVFHANKRHDKAMRTLSLASLGVRHCADTLRGIAADEVLSQVRGAKSDVVRLLESQKLTQTIESLVHGDKPLIAQLGIAALGPTVSPQEAKRQEELRDARQFIDTVLTHVHTLLGSSRNMLRRADATPVPEKRHRLLALPPVLVSESREVLDAVEKIGLNLPERASSADLLHRSRTELLVATRDLLDKRENEVSDPQQKDAARAAMGRFHKATVALFNALVGMDGFPPNAPDGKITERRLESVLCATEDLNPLLGVACRISSILYAERQQALMIEAFALVAKRDEEARAKQTGAAPAAAPAIPARAEQDTVARQLEEPGAVSDSKPGAVALALKHAARNEHTVKEWRVEAAKLRAAAEATRRTQAVGERELVIQELNAGAAPEKAESVKARAEALPPERITAERYDQLHSSLARYLGCERSNPRVSEALREVVEVLGFDEPRFRKHLRVLGELAESVERLATRADGQRALLRAANESGAWIFSRGLPEYDPLKFPEKFSTPEALERVKLGIEGERLTLEIAERGGREPVISGLLRAVHRAAANRWPFESEQILRSAVEPHAAALAAVRGIEVFPTSDFIALRESWRPELKGIAKLFTSGAEGAQLTREARASTEPLTVAIVRYFDHLENVRRFDAPALRAVQVANEDPRPAKRAARTKVRGAGGDQPRLTSLGEIIAEQHPQGLPTVAEEQDTKGS